jgi:hypothetical protein
MWDATTLPQILVRQEGRSPLLERFITAVVLYFIIPMQVGAVLWGVGNSSVWRLGQQRSLDNTVSMT